MLCGSPDPSIADLDGSKAGDGCGLMLTPLNQILLAMHHWMSFGVLRYPHLKYF